VHLTAPIKMPPQRETNQALAQKIEIPSDPEAARSFQEELEKQLRNSSCQEHDLFSIRLALEEALVNAIKHGNQCDRNKKVEITYSLLPDRFEITITDQGSGFDPADVPDPTAFENLERPCGRGLMLIKHYMTEVSYVGRGNTVSMAKVYKLNGKK
jgi:serine/threonine-protein kinase RsbW